MTSASTLVEVREQVVAERIIVGGSVAQCFAVLSDFERYPEWAEDIKAVTVESRDARGRPSQVGFRAAAFGRSTCYTLLYDYA
ncbi:MAG: SRPBCC family protein, partial [Acidimicrobiales bacterium]